ncbi:MAG: hypothetical protein HYV93_09620, partial [Candidatus Rokubacteria bacterium]|nr:hypothetical protein [Candidatus Rokubacteria bacterium]
MQDEIKVQDDTSLARAVRWMTGFVIVRKEGKMPQDIDREGVHRLAREGAQIVEVLPAKEFEEDHL